MLHGVVMAIDHDYDRGEKFEWSIITLRFGGDV